MYASPSVKTVQLLVVSLALVQVILTNTLTYRDAAHLCFPMKSWWWHSSWYAKCYTLPFVSTFPVYQDDQRKHADTKSIFTIHYRSFFVCISLQIANKLPFLSINRPSVFFWNLWKLSETGDHAGRTCQFARQLHRQILIYQWRWATHLLLMFYPSLYLRDCSGSILTLLQQFKCPKF